MKEIVDDYTDKPLSEFKPGQRLHFKFSINHGQHEVYCPAEFIGIVRGCVRLKVLDGWEPDWYVRMDEKYPNRCYLYAKAPGEREAFCRWFMNTKLPAI